MKELLPVTSEVEAIGRLHLEGNIIPHQWFQRVRLAGGRPDPMAVVILADLVYWYRPVEVRDEETGLVLGHRRKFRGDLLQRTYAAVAEQFGFTKREAQEALHRLRDGGFIRIEFRTVEAGDRKLNNVTFLAPVPEAIARLCSISGETLTFERERVSRLDVTHGTKTSQEISKGEEAPPSPSVLKSPISSSQTVPVPGRPQSRAGIVPNGYINPEMAARRKLWDGYLGGVPSTQESRQIVELVEDYPQLTAAQWGEAMQRARQEAAQKNSKPGFGWLRNCIRDLEAEGWGRDLAEQKRVQEADAAREALREQARSATLTADRERAVKAAEDPEFRRQVVAAWRTRQEGGDLSPFTRKQQNYAGMFGERWAQEQGGSSWAQSGAAA